MDDETELETFFCISFPDTLAINKTTHKTTICIFCKPSCLLLYKETSQPQSAGTAASSVCHLHETLGNTELIHNLEKD